MKKNLVLPESRVTDLETSPSTAQENLDVNFRRDLMWILFARLR